MSGAPFDPPPAQPAAARPGGNARGVAIMLVFVSLVGAGLYWAVSIGDKPPDCRLAHALISPPRDGDVKGWISFREFRHGNSGRNTSDYDYALDDLRVVAWRRLPAGVAGGARGVICNTPVYPIRARYRGTRVYRTGRREAVDRTVAFFMERQDYGQWTGSYFD